MRALILLIVLFGSSANASTFIGNGGEGVFSDEKIYLRDLFKVGLVENIEIGSNRDFALRLPTGFFTFPIPEELLERKLTEINELYPPLGDYLREAILHFTWSLTEERLIPTLDDDVDPASLEKPGFLVQIANRFSVNVRISKNWWSLMDDNHKVALIIHEAIFGLVRTSCLEGTRVCRQSCSKARELTAELFLKRLDSSSLYSLASNLLDIPKIQVAVKKLRPLPVWNLISQRISIELPALSQSATEIRKKVRQACETLFRSNGKGEAVFSRRSRSGFNLQINAYLIRYGDALVSQPNMRIRPANQFSYIAVDTSSVSACTHSLIIHERMANLKGASSP